MGQRAMSHFYSPAHRDEKYGRPLNVAQYLLDCHEAKAVFDFCGGINFQLQLSPKLQKHLSLAAHDSTRQQPVVHDVSFDRLFKTPNYKKSARADNVTIFHG